MASQVASSGRGNYEPIPNSNDRSDTNSRKSSHTIELPSYATQSHVGREHYSRELLREIYQCDGVIDHLTKVWEEYQSEMNEIEANANNSAGGFQNRMDEGRVAQLEPSAARVFHHLQEVTQKRAKLYQQLQELSSAKNEDEPVEHPSCWYRCCFPLIPECCRFPISKKVYQVYFFQIFLSIIISVLGVVLATDYLTTRLERLIFGCLNAVGALLLAASRSFDHDINRIREQLSDLDAAGRNHHKVDQAEQVVKDNQQVMGQAYADLHKDDDSSKSKKDDSDISFRSTDAAHEANFAAEGITDLITKVASSSKKSASSDGPTSSKSTLNTQLASPSSHPTSSTTSTSAFARRPSLGLPPYVLAVANSIHLSQFSVRPKKTVLLFSWFRNELARHGIYLSPTKCSKLFNRWMEKESEENPVSPPTSETPLVSSTAGSINYGGTKPSGS